MARLTSLAEVVTEGQRLASAVEANSDDLPGLEVRRSALEVLLDEAHGLSLQQKALTASKQDVSKRLEQVLVDSRKIITVLRVTVKQHYGFESEKLVEFGMRPLRPRVRRAQPGTGPVTPPPGEAPPPQVIE